MTPTTPLLSDDARWQAVQNKDRAYDGQFVTGVRTTGIYCRPSCPSRIPHRQNVTFFNAPDEAEAAGFRACKRCAPNTQAYEAEIAARVCRAIEARLDERLRLDDLGALVGHSPFHLQRMFKRALGITPRQYQEAVRMQQFKDALKAGGSVTGAIYAAGFSSTSRLYESSDATLGMTPATYRKGGAGMDIATSVVDSALGKVLIAATARGICAVRLGDSEAALVEDLRRDFPAARIEDGTESLREWAAALMAHLSGDAPHLDLPLDIRGTAFQWRVWQALREIPYGETRSYTQVAEAIGQPSAARAVARACASNPAAVVIPCHRVIREDGSLSGYRWGLARKAALLDSEREHAAGGVRTPSVLLSG
ncbi:MAG: bifunctional DNA-binding transcriptional regulator/O6-methylguanine-DNA methyltransferase Ada [Anaerolineae bacterium]|nr:bifunctional DNA-binding transcriptional regulator/O6-methylguanine-DNA methyltransferase Ada [Anaerolineae bacterium]